MIETTRPIMDIIKLIVVIMLIIEIASLVVHFSSFSNRISRNDDDVEQGQANKNTQ